MDIRPPNSVILVGDPRGEIPRTMAGQLVAATSTRLAVGTRVDAGGETHLLVTDESGDHPPHLAFGGVLLTQGHRMTVTSVVGDTYVDQRVEADRTNIEVWVDDPVEPESIAILVKPTS